MFRILIKSKPDHRYFSFFKYSYPSGRKTARLIIQCADQLTNMAGVDSNISIQPRAIARNSLSSGREDCKLNLKLSRVWRRSPGDNPTKANYYLKFLESPPPPTKPSDRLERWPFDRDTHGLGRSLILSRHAVAAGSAE